MTFEYNSNNVIIKIGGRIGRSGVYSGNFSGKRQECLPCLTVCSLEHVKQLRNSN